VALEWQCSRFACQQFGFQRGIKLLSRETCPKGYEEKEYDNDTRILTEEKRDLVSK
jgi:hypothetical protein